MRKGSSFKVTVRRRNITENRNLKKLSTGKNLQNKAYIKYQNGRLSQISDRTSNYHKCPTTDFELIEDDARHLKAIKGLIYINIFKFDLFFEPPF